MAKTVSMGSVSLADLNDIVASATAPTKPTTGVLWLDTTTNILKRWTGSAWVNQQMELKNLDPALATVIENAVASLGTMANDNLLNLADRQQLKDDLSNIVGKVMANADKVMPTIAQLELGKKGSLYSTRQNALNAGLESTDASYIKVATEYQNLKTYLESLGAIGDKVFPWDTSAGNSAKNIAVVKDTFRDKWLQYYLAIETLNLATTQKIKENQEELDGKIDEISLRDKTSILQGNPIYTDKADDAVVHVGVDGKSEQNAGSGKNLFEDKMYENRDNFILGVYSTSKISKIKAGTRYTFSASKLISPELGKQMVLYIMDGTNGQSVFGTQAFTDSVISQVYNLDSRTVKKDDLSDLIRVFTAPESGKIYFAYYDAGKNGLSPTGDWFTDKLIEPQLEEGNIRTTYEPPAPSPDYPIPIKSLDKSFDIVSSVGRENLLINTDGFIMIGSDNGNTNLTVKENDYITITPKYNGNIYNNGGFRTNVERIQGEKYTLSFDIKTKTAIGMYWRPSENYTFSIPNTNDKWEKRTFTYTQTGPTTNSGFLVGLYGLVADSTVSYKNFKLEKGDTATPYSPAPEDIPYNTQSPTLYKTNILLSEPLRSVGDVKDRLFLDTDGLWKVERNVGEVNNLRITSGGWSAKASNNPEYVYFYSNQDKLGMVKERVYDANSPLRFNNFKTLPNQAYAKVAEEGVVTWSDQTPFIFVIKLSRIGSITDANINDWLIKNPTTVQYELKTPTTETLPADMQTKLNNIQSYKGSNYVYTFDGLKPELKATFKSNMWYRVNVLGEKLTYGRNWASNGNFAYKLEDSLWKNYYSGTVKEIVDISSEAPPFKNALHIKQTTSGFGGIIDAVIWDGAEANVLAGQNISMATWIKYQNIAISNLVMQVTVTGRKSDGTFVYDYPKVFSANGTNMSWERKSGSVKIDLPTGAVEITRILFRLGFAKSGTGEFWTTGVQLQTGNGVGEWSVNPLDTDEELSKTKARLIVTERELGMSVEGVVKDTVAGRLKETEAKILVQEEQIDLKASRTEAKEYASNAVNGLEIDGRNIMRYTDGIFTRAGGSTNINFAGQNISDLVIGEDYTFSVELKADINTKLSQPIFINSSNRPTEHAGDTVSQSWKRFVFHFKWAGGSYNGNDVHVHIYFNSIAGNFYARLPKLEKGTKATGWSLAPEDEKYNLDKKTGTPIRYIRDWLNGSDANPSNHWVEIQALTSDGTNRALKVLPTSNGAIANIERITDGVLTSNVFADSSLRALQWVQIDLGKVYYDIDSINVWHYYTDGRTYNETKTEVSEDGVVWTALFDSAVDGTYPETPEGKSHPINLVDRMKVITGKMSEAMLALTPDAITGTVMSQESFTTWKESVDNKADGQDLEDTRETLDSVGESLKETISKLSEVEQTSDNWGVTISATEEIVSEHSTTVNNVETFMNFSEAGLEIGKSDSDMKVNISNTQIDFVDNGTSVAYINGQQLYITRAEILESVIVGNHKIEKYAGSDELTVVSWLG